MLADTDCCTRNICGPSRAFTINIVDNTNREVMRLTRPLRCSTCWCPCCLQVNTTPMIPATLASRPLLILRCPTFLSHLLVPPHMYCKRTFYCGLNCNNFEWWKEDGNKNNNKIRQTAQEKINPN